MLTQAPVEYLPSEGHKVVVIDYNQLSDSSVDLSQSIEEAFGFDGLGILAVRNVPNFARLRQQLLPLGHKFASLPDEVKQKLEHKESMWSFGWSHGREILDGKPDYSKGSYYNNAVYDKPFDDEEIIKKYPSFAHPNIWPTDDLPELQPAFLALGRLIVDVGVLIARQCDRFVKRHCDTYEDGKLEKIIRESRVAKGRLLHYFPIDNLTATPSTTAAAAAATATASSAESSNLNSATTTTPTEDEISSWCGWHNDHGSLTGLAPAMYMSKEGQEVPNPDPTSGLYIRARNGDVVKVSIPADHLAFQIGETACVHSGGYLQATPHCVRGASGPKAVGVSRETMAVFMEPEWGEPMSIPTSVSRDAVVRGSAAHHLPRGVPTLASRWNESQDFGKFTEATLAAYY